LKKNTILAIFCIGLVLSFQNLLPALIYRNINMGKKNDLLSTPKTSTIIIEDSSEFLDGTLENLTISNNGYLMLESKLPSQPNWTNMTTSIQPSARMRHSMAYDSINGKVILFGGSDVGDNDETWAYDLDTNTWTNMTPSTKPSARQHHSMAYDSINDKVILFGGNDAVGRDDETWAYDLGTNTWTNMTPSIQPSARERHSMAYDSINGKVILFGGNFAGGYDDETWAYDLDTNTWTNMTPPTPKPSARGYHSMAYDSINDKVILFGGYDGGSNDETWAYDLGTNTWTNMTPSTQPSARLDTSMAYDSINGKVILFGGWDGSDKDETWAYDLDTNTWTNMTPSIQPSARHTHSMAYDSKHDKVILFGGWDNVVRNDETWAFGLFDYYQTGTFDSKIISPDDIYKISGEISWSPENQAEGTNLTIQIGFSNTINDEDFTYTRQYNSSFTFEGVARYFRYRVSFESNNDLTVSPILENIMIVYITEIESTQNIITIDESEGDTIVSEDNLLEIILISCLIGVVSVLAIITILNKKKIDLLEKHSKLTGRDLKSKRVDKIKK